MSTRTGRSPAAAMMRRVASMPSSSGMRMSMSTTSGSSALAIVTASAPSEASPTTSRSSSASRIILNPARTSAWSSAIRMRTLMWGVTSATAERVAALMHAPPDLRPDAGAHLEARATRQRRACRLSIDQRRRAVGVDDHAPQGAGDHLVQLAAIRERSCATACAAHASASSSLAAARNERARRARSRSSRPASTGAATITSQPR